MNDPTETPAKQYFKLSDAPNLQDGTIEVWYMQPEFFRFGLEGARPNRDPTNLIWTHTLLGRLRKDAGKPIIAMFDELWIALQGENWSPNGEARELIRSKGLKHTSMCIGDCFRLNNGEAWIVTIEGFKTLANV